MTTLRQILRLPERVNNNLILAADDQLQRAIAQKRSDRLAGRNEEAWSAYMASISNAPAELSRNERAAYILAIPLP